MSDLAERLTELELRYMQQTDLVEKLDQALTAATLKIDLLEKRVGRLETTVQQVIQTVDIAPNERPPHY